MPRRSMERELRSARERYERLFHLAPDPYIVSDTRGIIHAANEPAADLLGRPATFLSGKPLLLYVPREDRPAIQALMHEAQAAGRVTARPMRIASRGGRVIQVAASLSALPASGEPASEIQWLLRDVTEEMQRADFMAKMAEELEERVAVRTSELAEANRVKDEFLSLASHELRTPITVILGGAEFLERHPEMMSPDAIALIADCHGEAQRLRRIIDDLLALARADRGEHIEIEPLRLERVVRSVVCSKTRLYPERRFIVEAAPDLPLAAGSALYAEQVLGNFINNAVKYSPAAAPIEIAIGATDAEVTVSIRDHGKGLGDAAQAELFEPFYRAPSAAAVPGIGIGLTVCKRLTEAQGGRVWGRAADGGGTEFGFALTLYADDADAESDAQAQDRSCACKQSPRPSR